MPSRCPCVGSDSTVAEAALDLGASSTGTRRKEYAAGWWLPSRWENRRRGLNARHDRSNLHPVRDLTATSEFYDAVLATWANTQGAAKAQSGGNGCYVMLGSVPIWAMSEDTKDRKLSSSRCSSWRSRRRRCRSAPGFCRDDHLVVEAFCLGRLLCARHMRTGRCRRMSRGSRALLAWHSCAIDTDDE